MSLDEFDRGAIAGLQAFREQVELDRGRIENELEPPVDVVLELVDLVIRAIYAKAES